MGKCLFCPEVSFDSNFAQNLNGINSQEPFNSNFMDNNSQRNRGKWKPLILWEDLLFFKCHDSILLRRQKQANSCLLEHVKTSIQLCSFLRQQEGVVGYETWTMEGERKSIPGVGKTPECTTTVAGETPESETTRIVWFRWNFPKPEQGKCEIRVVWAELWPTSNQAQPDHRNVAVNRRKSHRRPPKVPIDYLGFCESELQYGLAGQANSLSEETAKDEEAEARFPPCFRQFWFT